MLSGLSPIAWIALGSLLIFIILLNISLITALKNRGKNTGNVLHKVGESIRDPWKKENEELDELAKRVAKFKGQASQNREKTD